MSENILKYESSSIPTNAVGSTVITKAISIRYNGKLYELNINKDITAYQSAKLTEFMFKIQVASAYGLDAEQLVQMIYDFEIDNQFTITEI